MEKPSQLTSKHAGQHFFRWLLLFLVILISLYYLWGVVAVPFHPDESTYLYMSSDFDKLLSEPWSLAWSPERGNDPRQRYRERDAPLTRYILGLGRSIAGLPSLPADWEWSKTWEQNQEAGALPDQKLLTAGRVAVTLLLPISLLCIYLTGVTISGRITGLLAALLLGTNTLILLHSRRAMAEGALTFGITFALWSFLQADRRSWLAGLGAALAFNAKHSAFALPLVGLLAVLWTPSDALQHPAGKPKPAPSTQRRNWIDAKRVAKYINACAQYLGIFILLTIALNPYLWRHPLQALRASWFNRQDILQRQVTDIEHLAPEQVLKTPAKRAAALLANLYLTQPSFSEVGNYRFQTTQAEQTYLATIGHNLMRGIFGGGVLLTLTLFGLVVATLQARHAESRRRRALVLTLLATLAQTAVLILLIPLPWQRYVIPAVPFACLWCAYAVGLLLDEKAKARQS